MPSVIAEACLVIGLGQGCSAGSMLTLGHTYANTVAVMAHITYSPCTLEKSFWDSSVHARLKLAYRRHMREVDGEEPSVS